jgi:hypothetical protein
MNWIVIINVDSAEEFNAVRNSFVGIKIPFPEMTEKTFEEYGNQGIAIRVSSKKIYGTEIGWATDNFYKNDSEILKDWVKVEMTATEFLKGNWNDLRGMEL